MPLIPSAEPARHVAALLSGMGGTGGPGDPLVKRLSSPPLWNAIGLAIEKRRSTRSFLDRPVAGSVLAEVVRTGVLAFGQIWPADLVPARSQILLLAARVAGLHAGLYRFEEGEFIALDVRLPDVAWDSAYAGAPALMFICAHVGAAATSDGVGYGETLVRAAALGQAMWLGAVSLGLAGNVYGGTSADVTRIARLSCPALGWQTLRHVFTVAVGYGAGLR